ncbi:MAG: twin-arginine translocase subunit TatC, partial [Brevundimonas sp.]|nr:twin-arginine translocase subunit TatC [Brevundimonas sp.]
MDHLVELRGRLVICVVAFVIGFIGCFAFAEPLYIFLVKPFAAAAAFHAAVGPGGHVSPLDLILGTAGLKALPTVDGQMVNLIYTAPLEILFTKMKLAGFGAVVVAFPVLAWQVYSFVAPGLYKRERKAFVPFLLASPTLFIMGASLVYFVILPFVLWFSLSQQIVGDASITVELLPKVSDYLSLVTTLLLAFGLCFQLPVVLT